MDDRSNPTGEMKIAIILRGGPAVGKSTVSHALARLFPRSARIEHDILRYMVVGGLVATKGNIKPYERSEEYFRQCRLGDKNAFALARNFVKAGFVVIISGLNGGESAETFHLLEHPEDLKWYPEPSLLVKELPGVRIYQVILDARPEVLADRMEIRGWRQNVIEFVLMQRQLFLAAAKKGNVELVIDTSIPSPLSIAKRILVELNLPVFREGEDDA